MKLIEKRPYLFVVALIFVYGLYVLFMRTKTQIKEGFHDTPLNEISQLIKGGDDIPIGSDIKSIIIRYQSTSGSQQFDKTIQEIDTVIGEIDNIKKQCENDVCDNLKEDKIDHLKDVVKKMIYNIETLMTTSNMSTPDKELLTNNLDKIKRFE